MKKIVLIILALFLLFTNTMVEAAPKIVENKVEAQADDGFNLKASLRYKKVKNKNEYKTVVLLHSLGYSSEWWGDLPDLLLAQDYAVLTIDLRGHGESTHNSALKRTSWKGLKQSAYDKYPSDVITVLNKVIEDNPKRKFFNEWALVGSDVGASAGIIAADKWNNRPKTIVMLSPNINFRGLYIPVSIAHLDNVDFLSISGTDDNSSKETENYLKKFAQAGFTVFVSKSKTTGMLILKNDEMATNFISKWIKNYLN